MNIHASEIHWRPIACVHAVVLLSLLAGCERPGSETLQGYVEGEYLYIASPLPGVLKELHVERGGHAKAGEPLFVLEDGAEIAARALAAQKLEEGQAQLEDARKGKRPSEIASIQARLEQNRSALELSEKEFLRQSSLQKSGGVSEQDLDKARAARDQDQQRVSQLIAELETARLGARSDQITAAEASVRALEAALAKADWDLSQKRQSAPQDALVFDTLHREGEWVAAGRPVVVLLPSQNIKVRTFVPETVLGTIHQGDSVSIRVDGVGEAFTGKVSFISPRAEYTPPVIYSQENRKKLVFMIEVVFEPEVAAKLHPGQPVEVEFTR